MVWEGSKIVNSQSCSFSTVKKYINLLAFQSKNQKIQPRHIPFSSNYHKEGVINIYHTNVKIPFGTAAAMADIQAYQDAVELCSLDSYITHGQLCKFDQCNLSIISQYAPYNLKGSTHGSGRYQFHSTARSIEAFKKGVANVNVEWYLANQVLLVVHVLALSCVEWKCKDELHSLEVLCKTIGLDLTIAKITLSQKHYSAGFDEVTSSRSRKRPQTYETKNSRSTKTTTCISSSTFSHRNSKGGKKKG